MSLAAYAERLDLALRLQLLKPGDSLRKTSARDLPAELRGPSLGTFGWWQRRLKWAVLPLQAALFLLAFFWPRNWPLSQVTLPTGDVDGASIATLWSVEATLFGLIAAFTPVVIASASDRLDRTRMIRRFRQDIFTWFVVLGLLSLSLMALAEFFWTHLPKGRGTAVWLLGSFLVLIVALFLVIRYTYSIIVRSPQRKLEWVLEEAEEYFRASLIERYALAWLKWPHRGNANQGAPVQSLAQRLVRSNYLTFVFDVRGVGSKAKAHRLVTVSMTPHGKAYIKDVSLGRLNKWLQGVATPQQCSIRHLWLAGAPNRPLKPLAPIAAAKPAPGQRALACHALEGVMDAYFVGKPPSTPIYFRQAMKDFRDRAAMAARNGQVAEFEFILESFSDLVVTFYRLATKLEETVKTKLDLSEEQRAVELNNLEPRTALRAVLHELGEEVFATDSPDVIKAWLHQPHRILENTRQFPTRFEPAVMYPWFRAANLIRGKRADIVEKLDLILESLERRLLTYGRELMGAIKLSPPAVGTNLQQDPLQRELGWYLRIIGKLLSVINEPRRTDFMQTISEVLRLDGATKAERKRRSATIWIECARHLVADFLNPTVTSGPTQNVAMFCTTLHEIRSKHIQTIKCLMSCWCRLLATQEAAERQMSQLYDQMIDMTWEEQTELLQGVIVSPVSRHRGKAGIVWLALQLRVADSVEELTAVEEHAMSDLIRGDSAVAKDLEALPCKVALKPMKTFAYGSNLCWERLRESPRLPSAIPVAKASLDDWSLEMSKYSSRDGSGKANIVPKKGAHVWGVIYEFDAREKPQLDIEEGGYTPKPMDIVDCRGVTHAGVLVYLANKPRATLVAFNWYKAYILAGARQHDFPAEYLKGLESLPERIDAYVERRRQNQVTDCGGRPDYLEDLSLIPSGTEIKEEENLVRSMAPTNGDRNDPVSTTTQEGGSRP